MFKRFNALFWMIGLGIIIALKDGYYPTLYYFQLIYYFAALILLVLGFSLLFSTIVVVFRDFSHIIDYIFHFLLYVSGAAIDLTLLDAIPGFMRQALLADPFIYVMEGFRDAIFPPCLVLGKTGLCFNFLVLHPGIIDCCLSSPHETS